jgi:hypothetical protein
MLKKVKEEERLREEAGYYDEDLDSDDEETRKWLEDASRIEAKEKLRRLEHTLNKTDKPQIPRRIVKKRERTMDKLNEELGGLGVDMKRRKMANLIQESEKPQRGKSVKRVGRTPSLQAKRATPKDQMIPDLEVSRLYLNPFTLTVFRPAKKSKRLDARLNDHGRRRLARERQIVVFSQAGPSICSAESVELARRNAVNSSSVCAVNPHKLLLLLITPCYLFIVVVWRVDRSPRERSIFQFLLLFYVFIA